MTIAIPERDSVKESTPVIGTLVVSVKVNYGRTFVYPECNASRLFARIAKTETLTDETLNLIKALGYEVRTRAQASQVL